MTMRYEKRFRVGEPGAVYEFDVKLLMRMRGVNVSDEELYVETQYAVRMIGDTLRSEYPWIGNVYLTGRSGGWLAVEDRTGGATHDKIVKIEEQVDQARADFETAIIEEFGYTANGRQQSLRFRGHVDPKTRKAYDFFKAQGGGIVGRAGAGALNLARAEAYAAAHDWEYEWSEDPEPYERGDAEDEDPFEVLQVLLRDADGNVIGSLGQIGMSGDSRRDRDYRRLIEAELALEAMPNEGLVQNRRRARHA